MYETWQKRDLKLRAKRLGFSSFFTLIKTIEKIRDQRDHIPASFDPLMATGHRGPRSASQRSKRSEDLARTIFRARTTRSAFSCTHVAYIPSEALTFSESRRAHQQRRICRPAASQQRTRGPLRDRERATGSCLRTDLRKGGNRQRRFVIAQEADRQCLRQQVINFNENIVD